MISKKVSVLCGVLIATTVLGLVFLQIPAPQPHFGVSSRLGYASQPDVLIPGTIVFYKHFDATHGITVINGTLDLAGGEQVIISCGFERTEAFGLILHCPGDTGVGILDVQPTKVQAGAFSATFQASFYNYYLTIDEVSRDQLRQIASAHQAVFYVGKASPLTLNEDQLAQIRALLVYTDKLPD